MPDLLVRLYDLPPDPPPSGDFTVRRAMAYEKHLVLGWVRAAFGEGWASECDAAFANRPITCFLGTRDGRILGFACHEATCRGFFGPTGVAEEWRGRGLGTALLRAALRDMAALGYAYAVIGGAGALDFYRRSVGAIEIPGSSPGIYRDRLADGREPRLSEAEAAP